MRFLRPAAAIIALALLPAAGLPCSTVTFREARLHAQNFDWTPEDGAVFVLPRGWAKRGFEPGAPEWTSQYGSVTFSQYGVTNPIGGMNETGLTITVMWLPITRYPPADDRPVLMPPEWVQYMLDTCATVDEVLGSMDLVRIASPVIPIHFHLADANGNAASVEFIRGEAVIHTGDAMPVTALTNDPYSICREAVEERGSNGAAEGLRPNASLARFARAAGALEQHGAGADVESAFATLADLAQRGYTRFSIVYELDAGTVHWRTHRNETVRTIAFAEHEFNCATGALMADIHATAPAWEPVTAASNLALLNQTVPATAVLAVAFDEGKIRAVAELVEGFGCGDE